MKRKVIAASSTVTSVITSWKDLYAAIHAAGTMSDPRTCEPAGQLEILYHGCNVVEVKIAIVITPRT